MLKFMKNKYLKVIYIFQIKTAVEFIRYELF